MKTAAVIAIALLAANAFAGQPPSKDKTQFEERTVFITGSLIPQRIKLKRIGTTTVSPVRLIDRREIEQSGRQTTQGAIAIDPSVRVMGR